ncbi:hypothetical protein FKP32DRAFT_1753634 [Trametes sanguinea]|nr:hypothetical protein FKP32DRAFT_1753634 [Trametes sanguinea]
MASANTGPPWFARHPDGSIHFSGVPERLKVHPALEQRGITLAAPSKPGVVFRTNNPEGADHVVKVLDLATEELPIYERLLRDIDNPANHTVPCETERSGHPILIMPMLSRLYSVVNFDCKSQSQLLRFFYQLVEGVDYLHRSHIVHMDLCSGNVLAGMPRDAKFNPVVKPHRVYIIDFDTARQYELGPGVQQAIELPETQIVPPKGLTHFDPYSWDVYCLGRVLEWIMKEYCKEKQGIPRIAQWYIDWLIGDEQGCRGVCRCRPTARTARLFLAVLCLRGPLFDIHDGVVGAAKPHAG